MHHKFVAKTLEYFSVFIILVSHRLSSKRRIFGPTTDVLSEDDRTLPENGGSRIRAIPQNSARKFGEEFCVANLLRKRRNTLCISSFHSRNCAVLP